MVRLCSGWASFGSVRLCSPCPSLDAANIGRHGNTRDPGSGAACDHSAECRSRANCNGYRPRLVGHRRRGVHSVRIHPATPEGPTVIPAAVLFVVVVLLLLVHE